LPKTNTIIYQEEDGTQPLLLWLNQIPTKALAKCRVRIGRLSEMGHELRRPEADYLRDGIHELRVGLQGVNYRILYFFYGQAAVVLSHGLTKEDVVPSNEIDLAIVHKQKFERDPSKHSYGKAI
jgi:hypothetical protein